VVATWAGFHTVRVVALASGISSKEGKNLTIGRYEMVKRLVSIAAVLALFSTVALAQEGQASGTIEGPDTVAVQAGPGGDLMQGPGPVALNAGPGDEGMLGPENRVFQMRVRGPMGGGNVMWYHRGGMGSWWRNPRVAEEIGLSDQQKQQLEKISLDSRLKMIDLRADLEKQQVILGPMLESYHPDEAQVLEQVDKVSQARAALEKERVESMLTTRNVLTEEQWNKLKESRMGFHREFQRRDFHRHMGPPTPATPPSK
jgi:Spy/CpxP family protein refolding chaperone